MSSDTEVEILIQILVYFQVVIQGPATQATVIPMEAETQGTMKCHTYQYITVYHCISQYITVYYFDAI